MVQWRTESGVIGLLFFVGRSAWFSSQGERSDRDDRLAFLRGVSGGRQAGGNAGRMIARGGRVGSYGRQQWQAAMVDCSFLNVDPIIGDRTCHGLRISSRSSMEVRQAE